jgi:hypothetical protein
MIGFGLPFQAILEKKNFRCKYFGKLEKTVWTKMMISLIVLRKEGGFF